MLPKLMSMASSATKQAKCVACGQTKDPLDMVTVKRKTYCKACFKCSHKGRDDISPTNCAEIDEILYCDRHFSENINRHLFGGKDGECFICHKPVYLPEKLIDRGLNFHRACFKCCHGRPLSPSGYRMFKGALYCEVHEEEMPPAEEADEYAKIYNLPELLKRGILELEPSRGRERSSSGPRS